MERCLEEEESSQKNQTKNTTQHFEKYPIATKTTSSSTASPNFFEDGHKIGDKIKVWWQGENKLKRRRSSVVVIERE